MQTTCRTFTLGGRSRTITEQSTTANAKISEPKDSNSAREQLLEAASQIMREGDTVDISLSELALRAGLNSALVKYYFGNKQGLLLALLKRDMDNIVRGLDALIAKDLGPDEKLHIHIHAVIKTYFRFPYLNRLLMRMVRESVPEIAQDIANVYLRPIYKAYVILIDEGVKQGLFRAVDPEHFYFIVTGAADRFFTSRQVSKHCFGQDDISEQRCDEYAAQMLDILMNGMMTKV